MILYLKLVCVCGCVDQGHNSGWACKLCPQRGCSGYKPDFRAMEAQLSSATAELTAPNYHDRLRDSWECHQREQALFLELETGVDLSPDVQAMVLQSVAFCGFYAGRRREVWLNELHTLARLRRSLIRLQAQYPSDSIPTQ